MSSALSLIMAGSVSAAAGNGAISYTDTVGNNTVTESSIDSFTAFLMPGAGMITRNDPGWETVRKSGGTGLSAGFTLTNVSGYSFAGSAIHILPYTSGTLVGGTGQSGGNGSGDQSIPVSATAAGSASMAFSVPAVGTNRTVYLYVIPGFQDSVTVGTLTEMKIHAALSDASASPIDITLLNEALFDPGPGHIYKFTYRSGGGGTLDFTIKFGTGDGCTGDIQRIQAVLYSSTGA